MGLAYKNLDQRTRGLMLAEIERDIADNREVPTHRTPLRMVCEGV